MKNRLNTLLFFCLGSFITGSAWGGDFSLQQLSPSLSDNLVPVYPCSTTQQLFPSDRVVAHPGSTPQLPKPPTFFALSQAAATELIGCVMHGDETSTSELWMRIFWGDMKNPFTLKQFLNLPGIKKRSWPATAIYIGLPSLN